MRVRTTSVAAGLAAALALAAAGCGSSDGEPPALTAALLWG